MSQAGWYHDPNDAAQLRYFDGGEWTDHVQPATAHVPAPAKSTAQTIPAPPATAEERAFAALAAASALEPGQARQRARADAQRMLQRVQAGKATGQDIDAAQNGRPGATPTVRRSRGVRGFEVTGAEPSLGIAFLVNTICALLYAASLYVSQLLLESLASSAPSFLVTVLSPIMRLFTSMGVQGFFFWLGVSTGLITIAYLYAYAWMISWGFKTAAPAYRLRANGPFSLMVVMCFVVFVAAITLGLLRVNEPALVGLVVLAYLFVAMPVMIVNADLMKAAATFSGPLAVTLMVVSIAGFVWIGNKAGSFVERWSPGTSTPQMQQPPPLTSEQERLRLQGMPGAGTTIR